MTESAGLPDTGLGLGGPASPALDGRPDVPDHPLGADRGDHGDPRDHDGRELHQRLACLPEVRDHRLRHRGDLGAVVHGLRRLGLHLRDVPHEPPGPRDCGAGLGADCPAPDGAGTSRDCAHRSGSRSTSWRPCRPWSMACGACLCSSRRCGRSSRASRPPSARWCRSSVRRLPGPSYFAAGVILAVMIVPIVSAVTREVFASTPTPPARGRPGPGRDPLGRRPDRHAADRPGGTAGRGRPRTRPSDGRDDRRHARDRQLGQHRQVDLLARALPWRASSPTSSTKRPRRSTRRHSSRSVRSCS